MSVDAFRRRPARPLVLGHRGVRGPKPENTLAAFEQAERERADGVELDVRLCGSEHVIVGHDRTLSRVTSGRDSRDVELVPFNDLARVDLGEGQSVPRLDAVLDFCAARQLVVNVELKHDVSSRWLLVRRVLALLNAYRDAPDFVILSSFDPWIVRLLSSLAPRLVTAWLIDEDARFIRNAPGARLLGARAVHPARRLVTEARVRRWRRRSALVNVWTVNDPAEALRLSNLGVDAIISDAPGRVLAALEAPA